MGTGKRPDCNRSCEVVFPHDLWRLTFQSPVEPGFELQSGMGPWIGRQNNFARTLLQTVCHQHAPALSPLVRASRARGNWLRTRVCSHAVIGCVPETVYEDPPPYAIGTLETKKIDTRVKKRDFSVKNRDLGVKSRYFGVKSRYWTEIRQNLVGQGGRTIL